MYQQQTPSTCLQVLSLGHILSDATSLLHPHLFLLGGEKGKVSYAKSSLPETWCFLQLINYLLGSSAVFSTPEFLIAQNRGFLGQQMQFPSNGNH